MPWQPWVLFFLLSDFFIERMCYDFSWLAAYLTCLSIRTQIDELPVTVRWSDAHTDTDPIKIDESPIGKNLQVEKKSKRGRLNRVCLRHIRVVNISCGSSHAWSFARFRKFNGVFACCLYLSHTLAFPQHRLVLPSLHAAFMSAQPVRQSLRGISPATSCRCCPGTSVAEWSYVVAWGGVNSVRAYVVYCKMNVSCSIG